MERPMCCVPGCGAMSGLHALTRPASAGHLSGVRRWWYCAEHDLGPDATTDQQFHYLKCRADGTSHKLAEVFALGVAPGALTDREFLQGHCNGSQFESQPELGDYYRSVAESHGQTVKGKVYLGQLAKFPGDPEAWVAGRGDAERVLDSRGWGAEGAVQRKMTKIAEPLGIKVAEDFIEDKIIDRMQEAVDCGGRPQDVDAEAVREEVIAKHSHGRKADQFKEP